MEFKTNYKIMISPTELNKLINHFIENDRQNIHNDLANYSNIYQSAVSMGENGKKDSHQRKIKKSILKEFAENVIQYSDQLKQAQTFNEIYNIIQTCKIYGIGRLTIYDTAVRIGYLLDIYPNEVYLHQGAQWGASALGVRGNKVSKDVFDTMHEGFRNLLAHEIECFCCIYHNELSGKHNPINKKSLCK